MAKMSDILTRLKQYFTKEAQDRASGDSALNTSKADKVANGTENNIVLLDANGNIKDSGKSLADTGKIDTISINGTSVPADQNKNVDLPAYPTKSSLGLNNVDNTSDQDKPVSTAQQTALNLRALITETGNKIDLEINNTNFKMVAKLYDKNNNLLSTSTEIDLPLESVVVSGSYNAQARKVVLTLQNGSTIEFSVADLIYGLQSEITAQNPLSSDLVNDVNNAHKFVSAEEKAQITTNKQAIAGIKDGQNIDSFADVENALANKQATIDSSHKLSSDLVDDTNSTNKFIKEITTQYIIISDLQTGIYKLSYNGTKYLKNYNNTGSIIVQNGNGPVILTINYTGSSWHWYYITRNSLALPIIYFGYTSASGSASDSKALASLLTSHQNIKSLDTNNTGTLSYTTESLTGTGNILLHRIAKTGRYRDLIGLPQNIYLDDSYVGFENKTLDEGELDKIWDAYNRHDVHIITEFESGVFEYYYLADETEDYYIFKKFVEQSDGTILVKQIAVSSQSDENDEYPITYSETELCEANPTDLTNVEWTFATRTPTGHQLPISNQSNLTNEQKETIKNNMLYWIKKGYILDEANQQVLKISAYSSFENGNVEFRAFGVGAGDLSTIVYGYYAILDMTNSTYEYNEL